MNFKKKIHFALFSSHSYQRLLILYLAHYTHTILIHTDKWTHMDTHGHRCSTTFTFGTFCDMHVCQRYKFYIWHATDIHMHRYTNTCTHICRDTSTYRYRRMHTDIYKHTCRHTQTHMHIFLHTQTHTYMSGQFCLLILYLVAICQMSSGPHGPIFFGINTDLRIDPNSIPYPVFVFISKQNGVPFLKQFCSTFCKEFQTMISYSL